MISKAQPLFTGTLLLLGAGFLVANVRLLYEYISFMRRRRSALLTWTSPKPPYYGMAIAIGVSLGILVIAKLLVHPSARRHGMARALMIALEPVAQSEGRTLLTLDTWTHSPAEALYRSLGYVVAGVIPRYARGSLTPQLEAATFMYKELAPAELR